MKMQLQTNVISKEKDQCLQHIASGQLTSFKQAVNAREVGACILELPFWAFKVKSQVMRFILQGCGKIRVRKVQTNYTVYFSMRMVNI